MKLSDNIVKEFGALISSAYIMATEYFDPRISERDFNAITQDYYNIIMDIHRGIPYDHSHFSDKMINMYIDGFVAVLSAYEIDNTPYQVAFHYISNEILDQASEVERKYCYQTLDSFVKKLCNTFQMSKYELTIAFSAPLRTIGKA